jgi:hypothetical protein
MIREIIVKRSDFESNDDWIVVDSFSIFAKAMVELGYSTPDLPKEVLWNSQVTNAFVQINRNGPSLYFFNVLASIDGTAKWDLLVQATQKGLNALGDVPQSAVFDKIIGEYHANRALIVQGRQNDTPFILPNDMDLFCEFMPSDKAEDEFMGKRVEWVRSLKVVRVVPDRHYQGAIANLAR